MSGIAGLIHFDGATAERALVERMTAAMGYRGPDGIRHWVKGSVALGQCRLCTTPESLEETQPVGNEDESVVLVMDGRLDNWEELRQQLLNRGTALRNRSDAELVLRAYETWGRECLSRIDGDFALVVWDARLQAAFCARDRLGNRPFVYHWSGDTLAFSSEVHPILGLPWVRSEFNDGLLAEYLAFDWRTRDETFWKEVMRLPAAHRMHVGVRGPRREEYWRPDLHAAAPCRTDEDYIGWYRELLGDVVRRTSRSQQPVAFEVSGGLDSSALFAAAKTLQRGARLPAPDIQAYTLDFGGEPHADELEYARAVGQHLQTTILEVLPAQMPVEWYRAQALAYREFPGYPNGTMSLNLRKLAHENGCRSLVTGVGGDEWLGMGRPGQYYAEELEAGEWRTAWECFTRDCRTLGLTSAAWWALRSGPAPLLPAPVKQMLRTFRARSHSPEDWLAPRLRSTLEQRRSLSDRLQTRACRRRAQSRQLLALEDAYSTIAREWEERFSARLGLELRSPFWSAGIVQFAFSTPERLRSLGRTTKRLHRQALQGTLTPLVLDRTTKADFMVTFRRQLAAADAEVRAAVSRRETSWIRPDLAAALLDRRLGSPVGSTAEWQLWTLLGCDAL